MQYGKIESMQEIQFMSTRIIFVLPQKKGSYFLSREYESTLINNTKEINSYFLIIIAEVRS